MSTLVTRSIQTETGNSNMNMNIRTSIPLLVSLLALNMPAVAAEPTTTLQYDRPARSFHQSLPLGNGRIGAMVFGGVAEDRIVLNESSVWSGSREDANRPDAHRALPEIRRLLLAGKNAEAERLVNANFTCQYQGSGRGSGANVPFGCYQTLGNLRLTFGNSRSGPTLRCESGHRAWSADQEIEFSMDGNRESKWCIIHGGRPVVWQLAVGSSWRDPHGVPPDLGRRCSGTRSANLEAGRFDRRQDVDVARRARGRTFVCRAARDPLL